MSKKSKLKIKKFVTANKGLESSACSITEDCEYRLLAEVYTPGIWDGKALIIIDNTFMPVCVDRNYFVHKDV